MHQRASPYINFGANGVLSRITGVEELEIELDGAGSNVSITGDFSGHRTSPMRPSGSAAPTARMSSTPAACCRASG